MGKASRKDGCMDLRHGRTCSKNALSDTVNWRTRKWSSCTKSQALGWDDHQFKQEELESVRELSQVCSQVVFKKLVPGTNWGDPDILWSVNKLARTVTKWPQACDRRLARLISYIHHTADYQQYCHVGNTAPASSTGFISRL